MQRIQIENLCDENGMGAARDIFRHEGIALAAVGSDACIRGLCRTARQMGRMDFLFARVLSQRDYSLGKNVSAVAACVQEALSRREVKGVIVYASCMDILTGWDVERALAQAGDLSGKPIEVLYRGPLARRKKPPLPRLQKIWADWNAVESDAPQPMREQESAPSPEASDCEKILSQCASKGWDVLLLTPGGCKSCVENQADMPDCVKNTRFTDVFLSTGTMEELAEKILEAFPEDRPLALVRTMAVKMVGMDVEGLCGLLRDWGKNVRLF